MANMFALILVIATLVTGVLWCLDKFIFAPKRRERQAAAQAATGEQLDKEDAEEKVGPKPGWLETSASVFPVLAIVLVVRSFIYEPFQIRFRFDDANAAHRRFLFWWRNLPTALKILSTRKR